MIEKGKQVSIEYRVFSDNNIQIDTNVGEDPLVFLYGSQQILPALEEGLIGLDIGDNAKITLDPQNAYGEINPNAFKSVSADVIPQELQYEGALLSLQDENFGEMVVRIDRIENHEIVLDFNHPLAGKHLTFDVKIIDVC